MRFLKSIDEMLEAKDRRELDSKKRTSHHPSGYSDCMRKMFFDWTNFPVSNYRTATDIYKMLAGKWIHQGFAELLKELYGDRVQTEVEFTYEHPDLQYPIHGFMDNVIVIDGVLIGIELKTSFGRGIGDGNSNLNSYFSPELFKSKTKNVFSSTSATGYNFDNEKSISRIC